MKISVLIPVYNEENTIAKIIKMIEATGIVDEVIAIDDGSTDRTKETLQKLHDEKLKIIYNKTNIGKGSSIREGLKYVTGDIVIIQDADLEYNPEDYHALVEPIISGKAQIVYGSRWLNNGAAHIPPGIFKLGRWLVTETANLLYGIKITDEPTGYKVFKTEVIKNIPLKCQRFEFCPEITAKASRLGYKIYEVPISYNPRYAHEGKKLTYLDGIEAITTLFKYRFWKKKSGGVC